VTTSPDGTKRFVHCFLLFFSKLNKQRIKQRFIQDHLLFLTALTAQSALLSVFIADIVF
jgi:hypothetical protein